jgi:hypothetical protein|tara:strand:- start:91 stop:294 length:204 start_codon:yes stop_codon:yes gene_type:complete
MNSYQDGTGKWHSQYLELLKSKSVDSLKYVIDDCRKAIEANPENKNNSKYSDEIHYCHAELKSRQAK